MLGEVRALNDLLCVNEVFASIQGEGSMAGTPAVFIRLQGCPVRCPWCDTKYTWKIPQAADAATSPLKSVFEHENAPLWAAVPVDALCDEVKRRFPQMPLVILTGGEPCAQPVGPLCIGLLMSGYRVAIETSGFCPISVPKDVFVTLSPKLTVPGGHVETEALRRADEVKMVIGSAADLEALEEILPEVSPDALISLQPLSLSREATELCIRTVTERGDRWRLSVQTHKYLAFR